MMTDIVRIARCGSSISMTLSAGFVLMSHAVLNAQTVPPASPLPAANASHGPAHGAVVPNADRRHFMGARACITCHRSEYVAWTASMHFHGGGINRLDTSTDSSVGARYKARYGSLKMCLTCHVPPKDANFGELAKVSGTSCESCHGASGSSSGWLNRHAVYGPNITRAEDETDQHRDARLKWCDDAGMIRSGRIYELARNCYSCHIIGEEKLVQDAVGHNPGNELFDLIPWIQGEVRHNFHQNQRVNAESPTIAAARTGRSALERQRVMFIVSQLALIEVCLRNVSAIADEESLEESYVEGWTDRVDDAKGLIEELVEILEEPEEGSGAEPWEDPDLNAVVEAVDALGRRFRDLTRENARLTADVVATHGRNFAARHDGTLLKAIDEDFLLDPPEPKGTALEP